MGANQHIKSAEANGPIKRAFRDWVVHGCVFSSLADVVLHLAIDPVLNLVKASLLTVGYDYESDSCSSKAYINQPRILPSLD